MAFAREREDSGRMQDSKDLFHRLGPPLFSFERGVVGVPRAPQDHPWVLRVEILARDALPALKDHFPETLRLRALHVRVFRRVLTAAVVACRPGRGALEAVPYVVRLRRRFIHAIRHVARDGRVAETFVQSTDVAHQVLFRSWEAVSNLTAPHGPARAA